MFREALGHTALFFPINFSSVAAGSIKHIFFLCASECVCVCTYIIISLSIKKKLQTVWSKARSFFKEHFMD